MNHIFYTLRDNLIRSYIYYIPDNIFEDINKTAYKGIIKRSDLNKLGYFDDNRNGSTNLDKLNTVEFVTKSKLLEENILTLFKVKEKLKDYEFEYILDEYKEHVGAHAFITEQLHIHLKNYIKKIDDNIINLFLLQYKTFDKHYNAVSKHFGKVAKPETLRQQNIIKKFHDKFSKPGIKGKVPISFLPLKTEAQIKDKPKEKKKPLITNEEADRFLLEAVFNVDFSKIK